MTYVTYTFTFTLHLSNPPSSLLPKTNKTLNNITVVPIQGLLTLLIDNDCKYIMPTNYNGVGEGPENRVTISSLQCEQWSVVW